MKRQEKQKHFHTLLITVHCTFTSFPLNASLMVGKSNWLMYLFPFIKLGNPDAFTVLVSRYKWYLVIARLQLPALSFKGGVVSEGIFNLVPFLNKWTKSLPLTFHFFKYLKFAAFGPAQRMFFHVWQRYWPTGGKFQTLKKWKVEGSDLIRV